MELVPPSASPLLRTELPSASRRKHDVENADSSDSSSDELQMEPPSQQVMEPPSAAKRGRIRGKQIAQSPDSSGEALQMASASSGSHAVNIAELSIAAKRKLINLPPLSRECYIYTVPDGMKHSSKRLFKPRVVSIGPIHYNNKKLRANEHLKERYFAQFLSHTGVNLDECYKVILNQERRLRNCYADVIKLNSEDFVKMVMVDAAFLLMVLVCNYFRSLSLNSGDQIYGKPKMMRDIRYDILLLENQLPFFILEDLFKLSKFQNFLKGKFTFDIDLSEEAAVYTSSNIFFLAWSFTKISRLKPSRNALHILDLLRRYLIPEDWTPQRKIPQTRNIPNTMELHQAGIKFRVGSKENIFDISYHHGILKVPPLAIPDRYELVYRNILAFELCHCLKPIFSDYFQMMHLFTLSLEGTELLIQKGIITNGLANAQQVSTLFQNIDKGNLINLEFVYSDVIKGLNEYYERDCHKWMAICCEKYFKAPWAICSVSFAIILLLLTIVQTVFSILQVVLPK